jgi:hypothetical protein
MTDLASIRARVAELARKATPGPWQEDSGDVYDTRSDGAPGTPLVRADREYRRCGRDLTNDEREANSAYIAACDPQTILALCAEIDRLEARVGELEVIERLATDFIEACPDDDNYNCYQDGTVTRSEFNALAEAICRD